MTTLHGKTLFITGASRGIGLAIALKAARDGANIAIAAKTEAPHPKLAGTIYTAAKEVEQAVEDGSYELGITLSHRPPENLKVEKFGIDELVVVVSKRHRLASEAVIKPEVLSTEPLIVREATSGTRLFVESKFSEIGVPLTYNLELNNNQVIKTLVEANLGVAILSWRTVQAEVEAGRLSALKVRGVVLERPLALVSRKKHTLSQPARAFRSVLLASLSDKNQE